MKKFLSVLTIPLTALAVLTGAIALPLLVRPFYWAQIQALDIPARSGLTVDDLIAFPYGKNLKEGAPTVESDVSDLYSY